MWDRLTFFPAAHMVLCYRFRIRITLITHWYFSYVDEYVHTSSCCPVSEGAWHLTMIWKTQTCGPNQPKGYLMWSHLVSCWSVKLGELVRVAAVILRLSRQKSAGIACFFKFFSLFFLFSLWTVFTFSDEFPYFFTFFSSLFCLTLRVAVSEWQRASWLLARVNQNTSSAYSPDY